jgi:hypothetical protein
MKRRTFLRAAAATWVTAASGKPVLAKPDQRGPIKVLLWCWDSRMTWDDEPDRIQTRSAAAEQRFAYTKRPESYRVGFRRLVDYCAKTGIWGVIIWGFLRDSHGGIKAAAELCKYAADRGVAIVPGVGLCSYGGYYYEGDHPFNLNTYLTRHPERASVAREDGSRREVKPVLDPSLEANHKWWRDGLEWMLENFKIKGVNYEMGDFIVNMSERAVAARKALGFETNVNIKDIVVATSELMNYAYGMRPDGVFINALYRGYHQIQGFPAIPYADALHPKTVWEYTLKGMVHRPDFPDAFGDVPAHRQYGYLHWFNASTRTRDKDFTQDIKRVFSGVRRLGFEFVGTYGEIGVLGSDVADANYRAQVAYAKDST